jgi:cystathionine gamma-synthase
MKPKHHFATLAIKSTENTFEDARPVSMPLYLSTTYLRNPDGSYNHDFLYSRADNPNRKVLENSMALLEKGAVAYCFASGMAAVSAVFQSLRPGDHILLPDDIYFNIYALVKEVFEPWQLEATLVDMSDIAAIEAAARPNTKLIWLETPSNPQLKITDLEAVVAFAKKRNYLVAVDNTWPTPVLTRPIEWGVDIVVHSTTKYFGGHSDVLSGAVVLKKQNEQAEQIGRIQALSGGVPSPFDCWLISRGIQTLHLRVRAQTQTAQQLAEYLERHPSIEKVIYPGLESHPQHRIAQKQMPDGYGAMLSVLVKGNAAQAIAVSNRLELFTTATSLGGVESLVEHRKSVEGEDSPTPDNLLRISVGLEDVRDLIADWEQALV